MAALIPPGRQSFEDINGRPLVGGKVYHYAANTDTKKDTWQDALKSIPNTNPIILDARGQATIWGDGVYRQVLKDPNDVLIWDKTVSTLSSSDADATLEAEEAAGRAEAAANASNWPRTSFKQTSDSPINVTVNDSGTVFLIDATNGPVVVNLPQISTIDESKSAFAVGFRKTDISANTVTLVPFAGDVLGAGVPAVIDASLAGTVTLRADQNMTPDTWVYASFGQPNGRTIPLTFVAGTHFTPGVTTSINLGFQFTTKDDLTVHFDGGFQGPETYTLVGQTLSFDAPIPSFLSKVYVEGSTRLPIAFGASPFPTAPTNYGGAFNPVSGAWANATFTGYSYLLGKLCFVNLQCNVIDAGTGAGVTMQLPFPAATGNAVVLTGAEVQSSGEIITARANSGAGTVRVFFGDNSEPGTDSNRSYNVSGSYLIA